MVSKDTQDWHRHILHRERHWLFWLWVGATITVGAYLLLATPLVQSLGLPPAAVATVVPVLNLLLLFSGLVWLLRLVQLRRTSRRQ